MKQLERFTISGRGVQLPERLAGDSDGERVAWGQFDRQERKQQRLSQIDAWNKLGSTLIDWGTDPDRLADDGIQPPSGAVLARAYRIALFLQNNDTRPFDRVVTTGDGGVAFQMKAGAELFSVEIDADGTSEFLHFHNSRLVSRLSIAIAFDSNG